MKNIKIDEVSLEIKEADSSHRDHILTYAGKWLLSIHEILTGEKLVRVRVSSADIDKSIVSKLLAGFIRGNLWKDESHLTPKTIEILQTCC